ncbi:MAG: amino acid adenylation domain-containing protein, partial [bacterium]|nr:amino acid adenylation domain-containing protein [bacterium]
MTTVTGNIDMELSQIAIISVEEKKQILSEFNGTNAQYPDEKTIHRLFEEQVEKTPGATAVVIPASNISQDTTVTFTYNEFNERANSLARELRRRGLKPDTLVGIVVERSLEMLVGIFAILKAGGAYLPIDPHYPRERITYILQDSCVELSLAQEKFINRVGESGEWLTLENGNLYNASTKNLQEVNNVSDLCYAIYTSGSTGKPKGVMIQHNSLVNRLNWMQKAYPIYPEDRILHKTPFTFDVSVWELFWWAIQGAAICLLAPGDEKNPEAIIEAIRRCNVTTMHFVPSMLNAFLEYLGISGDTGDIDSLKQVFASGEALGLEQARRFNRMLFETNKTRLTNLYGPTEATIDVSYFDCSTGLPLEKIPIGKPIDNTQLYIVDGAMELQPVGIAGELCIGGIGVARGYLNKPELTADKFVPAQNSYLTAGNEATPCDLPTTPLYKTGDLSRWLPNGNIEFLGRMDYQVKIRGYRIELGEIESRLLQHLHIKEAVAFVKDVGDSQQDDKYICAYYVPNQQPLTLLHLNDYLSETLPEYMIPSYFIELEKIPLTPNGKIDRKALDKLKSPGVDTKKEYCPPRNRMEEKLVANWAEVLNIEKEKISIDANFFQLGGHSLKAVSLIAKIHKEFDVKVPLAEIFKIPNIRELTAYLEKTEKIKYSSIEPAEKKEYYHLSSAQKRLYILQQMKPQGIGYNMPEIIPIGQNAQLHKLEETFIRIIKRHESLRTTFHFIDEQPVQKIRNDVEFKIEHYEKTGADDSHDESVSAVMKNFVRPFDLTQAPLLRCGLVKTGTRCNLIIDMHHI